MHAMCIIYLQEQPSALVYADVISFKQKPDVLSCDLTDSRVEYAQLKAYSANITQLTTEFPDVTSHSVGMYCLYVGGTHKNGLGQLACRVHMALNSAPKHTVFSYCLDEAINLDSLLIQLKPALTDKWYEFGEAIGIPKETLQECTQYSSDQSLVEILDNWLRNHNNQPTWNEVANALTKIGLQQLALDIMKVYDTGDS